MLFYQISANTIHEKKYKKVLKQQKNRLKTTAPT